tara:strand:+ start:177 stop:554 length:378 start_codon:yes stop_codon:yes gene_type:complete
MLKHCFTNNSPLIKPKYYLENNHEDLYHKDRDYAINTEKLIGNDLRLYDRDIVDVRRYTEDKKIKLLQSTIETLKLFKENERNISTFKLYFNEYNGYILEYNGKKIETYNYLNELYVKIILIKMI